MARFQLLIRAEKLPCPKATHSWMPKKYPNSFCVVSNVSEIGSVLGIRRTILGVSEIVAQCSSPEWATVMILEHTRGTEHKIAVDVFHSMLDDTTGNTHNIHHSERRGHLQVNDAQQLCGTLLDVETILSNRNGVLQETLAHECRLCVRLEECAPDSSKGEFKFHLRGLDCQNTRRNFLDRPDFVFEIRRKQRGKTQDSWALVYRSNVAKATCNPYWDESVVDLATLVNNDLARDIQLSIWDTPSRILLGYTTTTIQGLVGAVSERGNAEKALDIVKPSHNLLHSTTRQGRLVVLHASLSMINSGGSSSSHHGRNASESSSSNAPQEPQESLSRLPQAVAVEILSPPRNLTFEDYARKQCSLELCVAIDFTRANGDYRLEGMPHYRSDSRMNDYEWCMGVMAESIRKYNSKPQIPLWGFGAQFHNTPYHIFQCGSSSLNHGSRELLNAYKSTFQTALEFGYEARYHEVIQAAAHYSKKQLDIAQTSNGLAYSVLLILTVGTERDILAAKEQIQAVTAAPLSIFFVRIDNGMHTTPFKVTEMDPNCTILEGSDFTKARDARVFAEAVMKNVKSQLPDYFLSQGIYPPPPCSS